MRYAALLIACLCASAIVGCESDDAGRAPEITTPAPTPTPTPTAPPTTARTTPVPTYKEPTGPVRVKKGQTRPGARLRFGQRAIVPIRDHATYGGDREGVVGIVVGPIRRTDGSKVQGNFDEKSRKLLARSTAYYAPITITNLSGDDLSIITNPAFDGKRSGGGDADVALIGGALPGCTKDPSPDTFDHKGAVWRTCMIAVANSVRIREVHYRNPPYGIEQQLFDDPPPKYNQYYGLGDIVWH